MNYNINAMKVISKSYEETIALGEKLGKLLDKGTFVTLEGDLAGGKTTFTKGIGKSLNISQIINSPTFTILKIYQGDLPLYHIDAYRLKENPYDLGFDEYYDDGIMVIEWPEYYENLPKERIEINFSFIDDNTRGININASDKYKTIVEELEKIC